MGRLQKRLAYCTVVALVFALAGGAEAAGDPPALINHSLIGGAALSDSSGVVGVNVAAGDTNAQLNATAISLGKLGSGAQISSMQQVTLSSVPKGVVGRAVIDGSAFSHSSGAISVNQAAGMGNAQANAIAISVGIPVKSVSDAALAQSATLPMLKGPRGSRGIPETSIGASAFNGARGIVQVNQSAGIGNATANAVALQIEGVGH